MVDENDAKGRVTLTSFDRGCERFGPIFLSKEQVRFICGVLQVCVSASM